MKTPLALLLLLAAAPGFAAAVDNNNNNATGPGTIQLYRRPHRASNNNNNNPINDDLPSSGNNNNHPFNDNAPRPGSGQITPYLSNNDNGNNNNAGIGAEAGKAGQEIANRHDHSAACKTQWQSYKDDQKAFTHAPQWARDDSESYATWHDGQTERVYQSAALVGKCVALYIKEKGLCQPEYEARLKARLQVKKSPGLPPEADRKTFHDAAIAYEDCLQRFNLRLPDECSVADWDWPGYPPKTRN